MASRVEERLRIRRRLPTPPDRRVIRERAGATQQDVADAMRERGLVVTRTAVCRWESGDRSPRGDALEIYVGVLEMLGELGE